MKEIKADILVVGAGLAGTLFALELAQKRPDLQILLLNKKEKRQSASFFAQGGIAAALPGTSDSMEQHLADTLEASAHSCNKTVATFFVAQAPEAIRTLEVWGTAFDQKPNGGKALALEGGHSQKRVLHHKDSTGKHIIEKLHAALPEFTNIKLLEDVQVLELIKSPESGAVVGAICWDAAAGAALGVHAKAVILAAGGLGSLYSFSTNPGTATGEGIYLATHAGAELKDLAYVQFHPTALWQASGTQLSLISEAVRGAGAILRNERGERFMMGLHPRKELAPRDVVSRCISNEIKNQEKPYVFLDATALGAEEWESHFPGILELCRKAGVDPVREWIPVVPAAHYSCGGIATSVKGDTSVEMLFVIGETACTGLHGANRLASNSLLEATVMATSLAAHLARIPLPDYSPFPLAGRAIKNYEAGEKLAAGFLENIRALVQNGCGIVKTSRGMQATYQQLLELKALIGSSLPSDCLQYCRLNMVLETALLLATDCQQQIENVGVFFNSDLEEEALTSLKD